MYGMYVFFASAATSEGLTFAGGMAMIGVWVLMSKRYADEQEGLRWCFLWRNCSVEAKLKMCEDAMNILWKRGNRGTESYLYIACTQEAG